MISPGVENTSNFAVIFLRASVFPNETSGKEGVEVLKNEPYEKDGKKGQYTHKIYHLGSRVPSWLLPIIPKGCLKLYEEAWNEYPYCKTGECNMHQHTNEFLTSFVITIETWHKGDMGEAENVHEQDAEKLKQTEVVYIDIAAEDKASKSNKSDVSPSTFKSVKTGRGPLGPDWKAELGNNPSYPHMCAYKLVTVECKILGAQSKIESYIHKFEKDLFTKFHKQLFCWMDDWIELSLDDIRRLEDDTKKELEQLPMSAIDITLCHFI
uniref:Phosphatidylinositol transfer protein alpha isoform n=1 Tax=Gouania willdenowi TaxID=441366 RepID=A0A8C5EBY6_GOUWI